jgi:hypothetical protein
VCDKRFAELSHLSRHARLHSDNPTVQYKVCGIFLSHISSFSRHMKTHNKDK